MACFLHSKLKSLVYYNGWPEEEEEEEEDTEKPNESQT